VIVPAGIRQDRSGITNRSPRRTRSPETVIAGEFIMC
jgi:hypothetical protein